MKTPIENLLAKYFAGESSKEERAVVEKFKAEHPDEFENFAEVYHTNLFDSKTFDSKKALQQLEVKHNNRKKNLFIWLYSAAAVFTGILLIYSFITYTNSLKITIHNNSTALMEYVLPDGSELLLDKNATLSYKKNFWGQFPRKVKMKGRISFHITKDPSHPFVVNAHDINVTVLGTRFVVNEVKDHTQVFLTEGKVKVSLTDQPKSVIISKPGEQVLVSKNGNIKQNRINPSLYASWENNKISFNNCTVKEIVDFLNDSYGIKVNIPNPEALNRKLYGSAPADDARLIVNALSQILNQPLEVK